MRKFFKNLFYLCFIIILLSTEITACAPSVSAVYHKSYYVATNGNDNNSGTLEKPFASIQKAQDASSSGDTVYIRGGIYTDFTITDSDSNYNYVHEINKSGITYKAYSSNEVPIFDFSNITTSKRVAAFYITPEAKTQLK